MASHFIWVSAVVNLLERFFVGTQMAVGVVDNSNIEVKGFIKKNRRVELIENSKTLFEIGSITKVFTTHVLAQLVLEGKISLDDEVSTFLLIERLKKSKITFLQLANHTSGLPRLPENFYTVKNYDEENPYKSYDETALLDYLNNHLKLNSIPGEKFEYSNLNSGLLSYILSKIEQKSFDEIVKERIFKPMKMNDSTFDLESIGDSNAQGLDEKGKPAHHWEGGILNGCIGIASTAEDMVKFIAHILDVENPIANLQLKKTFQIEESRFVGLGWGIRDLKQIGKFYNHGGGSKGFSCYMRIHRKTGRGIILLTNVSAFHSMQQRVEILSEKILNLMISREN